MSTEVKASEVPSLSDDSKGWTYGARLLALLGGLAGLAVGARGNIRTLRHLYWDAGQVPAAASSLESLIADHPVRTAVSAGLCLTLAYLAEVSPRRYRRLVVIAWIAACTAAAIVYLLSALSLASPRVVEGIGLAAVAVAVMGAIASSGRRERLSRRPTPSQPGGIVAALIFGAVASIAMVRGSLDVVTEWDAIVYHVSFARDWMLALPSLPHVAGPSLGAELSYNYPALFPALGVTFARTFSASVIDVVRYISPLAFATLLPLVRTLVTRRWIGWLAPALVLGSPIAVGYAEWPTAYMVLALLLVLAAAELTRPSWERGRAVRVCALLGLACATELVGIALAVLLVVLWVVIRGTRPGSVRSILDGWRQLPRLERVASPIVLLLPLVFVSVASMRRTRALFFPWITWPHGGSLLPSGLWSAASKEILVNGYSQTGSAVGELVHPFAQLLTIYVLFPGGLIVAAAAAVALAIATSASTARLPALLLFGLVAVVAALVVTQLVWPRYLLPLVVVPAIALVRAATASAAESTPLARGLILPALTVAAALATAAGASLALAGPNDYNWTVFQDFRGQHVSPFENAAAITDTQARLETVFGDDARAWRETDTLNRAGFGVGTFDVRNLYAPYRASLQLDGLAGSHITGSSSTQVVHSLRRHGIGFVFVPSWFWEPGGTQDPLVTTSPVLHWVGADALPAWRVYLPERSVQAPSVLYHVGPLTPQTRRELETYLAGPPFSVAVPLAAHTARVGDGVDVAGAIGGPVGWYRIAAPVSSNGGEAYRLTLTNPPTANATIFEPAQPSLFEPIVLPRCAAATQQAQVDFQFPGSPLGYSILDLSSTRRHTVTGRFVQLHTSPRRASLLLRGCTDSHRPRLWVFPHDQEGSRIIVLPHGRRHLELTLQYRNTVKSPVSINVYDTTTGRWRYEVGAIERCGGGGWQKTTFPLPFEHQPTVELGLVVRRADLEVRRPRILTAAAQPASAPTVSTTACGEPTAASGGSFIAGLTSSRITVSNRGRTRLWLSFQYQDRGRGFVYFNAFDIRRNVWKYKLTRLLRCATSTWRSASLPVPFPGNRVVPLGPVITATDLRLRNLRLTSQPGASPPTACPAAG